MRSLRAGFRRRTAIKLQVRGGIRDHDVGGKHSIKDRPVREGTRRHSRNAANITIMRCEQQPTMTEPLAHSARDGAPAQTYHDHVGNVCRYSSLFAGDAAAFSPKWREPFLAVVRSAAAYHDLGKLDELFQEILRDNQKSKSGYNHVEAGTAHLLRSKRFEAAFTVSRTTSDSHRFRRGRSQIRQQSEPGVSRHRRSDWIDKTTWESTDYHLGAYLSRHERLFAVIGSVPICPSPDSSAA